MKPNAGKVKLILFVAIAFITALLVINISLLVSIHAQNKQITQQETIIKEQEQKLNYYNQQAQDQNKGE